MEKRDDLLRDIHDAAGNVCELLMDVYGSGLSSDQRVKVFLAMVEADCIAGWSDGNSRRRVLH